MYNKIIIYRSDYNALKSIIFVRVKNFNLRKQKKLLGLHSFCSSPICIARKWITIVPQIDDNCLQYYTCIRFDMLFEILPLDKGWKFVRDKLALPVRKRKLNQKNKSYILCFYSKCQ